VPIFRCVDSPGGSRCETAVSLTPIAPRRPATGGQERAERTRAAVIDETVRCVLEEGFGAASAKHITERAGVTWGVIQYHFGDRDGLLMAVVDLGYSQLVESLNEVQPALEALSGRARIVGVVDALWQAFSSPTSLAAMEILIATRPGRQNPASAHLVELTSALSRLARHLAQDLDVDRAQVVGEVIWTMLRGSMLNKMVAGEDADTGREREALVDLIMGYVEHQSNMR
jgi:TetR/AcrR family transcriptional regulator, regulator of cefoperazone and chloramphenicol sensitivity